MTKIVFFGTPEFAVPSLKRLMEHPAFSVAAVVSQPDKRRGRGAQLIPAPVKQVALTHQLPIWQPQRVKKDGETLQKLHDLRADVFVVVAYGQILSQQILDMPRLGCVNAHGSILPKYRGAAPIQWSLYHGEPETGITTMRMDAGMDTGPMLLEARTPIALLENFEQVAARLAAIAADLLVETLIKLEQHQIEPIPQDHDQATYAPLIQKPDYALDWSKPAIALHHQVRGFYPNCVATFRGEPMKVMATVPLLSEYLTQLPPELQPLVAEADPGNAPPGAIARLAKGLGPIIQTGTGLLLLRTVQPAGKKPQSGWDFVNGNRVAIGETFTNGSVA